MALTLLSAAAWASPGDCTVVLGDLSGDNTNVFGNAIYYTRFSVGSATTINYIEAKLGGATSMRLGIYTDSGSSKFPVTLLAETSVITATGSGVWRAPISDTSLAVGNYWLAILAPGSPRYDVYKRATASTYFRTQTFSFGPLPTTASADASLFTAGMAISAGFCEATPTPTISPTSTISPTFTVTATMTPSPTVTGTSTPTATPSVTATFPPTPTVTLSATPGYRRSGLGKMALGPVPVHLGQPLCLYFDALPEGGRWTLYNFAGEKAMDFSFGADELDPCVATAGLAPGLYYAVGTVRERGTDKPLRQKVVVLP